MTEEKRCPDCGARLSVEPWAAGLCLPCLLDLGLSAPSEATPGQGADAPTIASGGPVLAPGQVLGDRYRIRSLLGRGGMGEVFRAFDLKLRVDVALKAVLSGTLVNERAISALRQEVRSAREVVSANVCRVFDLVEFEGRELVAMEFVDGVTLADLLNDKSPLDLQEAREIASQFLSGLEAIHAAGLVHRDIKPENVMITRAGRVVVMDFGIARALTLRAVGTISGTPAYMSGEQARGETVDARADVFSAGVVLTEMVARGGARGNAAREAVWRGVHAEPPRVDETPWAGVLRKAVSRMRDQRYSTAAALSRALDEVTLRSTGAESQRPYPGLASFTERDAEYFLGRELEIEDLWKKLRRPQLLALIGPSGAGKSSFLRAGLAVNAPPGWRVIFATPSDRPFASLAHALAPELAGDAQAVARLIDVEQPGVAVDVLSRWRRLHDHAVLVVDQFEELFTQSAPLVQERFAAMLAQVALDADVHVLLSLRDDFLFQCHKFDSLTPIFSQLTAIGPPAGAALRRALVQPALKCGYRFEDETMVDEMLAEVAGERGALPLIAFAMARLWDQRDREHGLLTRAAYQAIGGVGGALAQHAESTLERIGQERAGIVRELFRNMVSAQGTRATIDRDELLSVFANTPDPAGANTGAARQQAIDVLDELIDARLLTSYELPAIEPDDTGHHRIEIVHESLLASWPRLVRWQAQDQQGAQFRDQLRQAARFWEERGKPDDLLWTGTSFREYALWRERYAGTLSATEDAFARAMTARDGRHKRQRRVAVAAVTAATLAVTMAMGVLWRRSEGARAQAVAAAAQAEAGQLLTLSQFEIERHPTAAVAYALASLERADSPHARLLALRALWQGPTAFAITQTAESSGALRLAFSGDAAWLAGTSDTNGATRLWHDDGSTRTIPPADGAGNFASVGFGPDSRSFFVMGSDGLRIHSLPAVDEVKRIAGRFRWALGRGGAIVTGSMAEPAPDGRPQRLIKSYPFPTGQPETHLGVLTFPPQPPAPTRPLGATSALFDVDPTGQWMFSHDSVSLVELPLRPLSSEPRLIVRGDDRIAGFDVSPEGARLYTFHESGTWRVWARATGTLLRTVQASRADQALGASHAGVSRDERWLAAARGDGMIDIWDLAAPPSVEPRLLRSGGRAIRLAFEPGGTWMAVQDSRSISMWPLTRSYPYVLRAPATDLRSLVIDPRGKWIAAGGPTASLALWPIGTPTGRPPHNGAPHTLTGVPNAALLATAPPPSALKVSPNGDVLAAGTRSGVWLIPLDGRRPERLPGFSSLVRAVAFAPDGRRLAAGGGLLTELNAPGEAVIRIWNLDTREARVLKPPDGKPIAKVAFMPDGRLLAAGAGGLRLWEVAGDTSSLVIEGAASDAVPSADGRHVLVLRGASRPGGNVGAAAVYEVSGGRSWDLVSHGTEITAVAWHPSGHVVTGSRDGTVRVGKLTGEEPHLLLGHTGSVWCLEVDPEHRWIASASEDSTVRMWPMPEGQPFHTLSRDELLKRLRAITNYRAVRDATSPNGYRLGFEPFSGWKSPPPRW